ncbi:hypothetical protein CSC22_5233 (plasmid) [Escherichia coli]|nr:hypothetical protein CSC22_5233 [Escherichia coli]
MNQTDGSHAVSISDWRCASAASTAALCCASVSVTHFSPSHLSYGVNGAIVVVFSG